MQEKRENVVGYLRSHFLKHVPECEEPHLGVDYTTDWDVYIGIPRDLFSSEVEILKYCEEDRGCTLCNPSSALAADNAFAVMLSYLGWDVEGIYAFCITGDDFENLLTNAKGFCNWFFPMSGVQDEQD